MTRPYAHADDRSTQPTPSSEPVAWTFEGGGKRITIIARTWFAARELAMVALGCGPDECKHVEPR